ncbi:unnamed protein product [Closterium sp. NIES-54]
MSGHLSPASSSFVKTMESSEDCRRGNCLREDLFEHRGGSGRGGGSGHRRMADQVRSGTIWSARSPRTSEVDGRPAAPGPLVRLLERAGGSERERELAEERKEAEKERLREWEKKRKREEEKKGVWGSDFGRYMHEKNRKLRLQFEGEAAAGLLWQPQLPSHVPVSSQQLASLHSFAAPKQAVTGAGWTPHEPGPGSIKAHGQVPAIAAAAYGAGAAGASGNGGEEDSDGWHVACDPRVPGEGWAGARWEGEDAVMVAGDARHVESWQGGVSGNGVGYEKNEGARAGEAALQGVQSGASSSRASRLFEGVVIWVNGYMQPTHQPEFTSCHCTLSPFCISLTLFPCGMSVSHQELRQLMLVHGGVFENYFHPSRVTHIICANLPDTKLVQFRKYASFHLSFLTFHLSFLCFSMCPPLLSPLKIFLDSAARRWGEGGEEGEIGGRGRGGHIPSPSLFVVCLHVYPSVHVIPHGTRSRTLPPIVHPNWIVACIHANRLLPCKPRQHTFSSPTHPNWIVACFLVEVRLGLFLPGRVLLLCFTFISATATLQCSPLRLPFLIRYPSSTPLPTFTTVFSVDAFFLRRLALDHPDQKTLPSTFFRAKPAPNLPSPHSPARIAAVPANPDSPCALLAIAAAPAGSAANTAATPGSIGTALAPCTSSLTQGPDLPAAADAEADVAAEAAACVRTQATVFYEGGVWDARKNEGGEKQDWWAEAEVAVREAEAEAGRREVRDEKAGAGWGVWLGGCKADDAVTKVEAPQISFCNVEKAGTGDVCGVEGKVEMGAWGGSCGDSAGKKDGTDSLGGRMEVDGEGAERGEGGQGRQGELDGGGSGKDAWSEFPEEMEEEVWAAVEEACRRRKRVGDGEEECGGIGNGEKEGGKRSGEQCSVVKCGVLSGVSVKDEAMGAGKEDGKDNEREARTGGTVEQVGVMSEGVDVPGRDMLRGEGGPVLDRWNGVEGVLAGVAAREGFEEALAGSATGHAGTAAAAHAETTGRELLCGTSSGVCSAVRVDSSKCAVPWEAREDGGEEEGGQSWCGASGTDSRGAGQGGAARQDAARAGGQGWMGVGSGDKAQQGSVEVEAEGEPGQRGSSSVRGMEMETVVGLGKVSSSGRGRAHSTQTDPNFVKNYFRHSRLHFIGSWRNRYRPPPAITTGDGAEGAEGAEEAGRGMGVEGDAGDEGRHGDGSKEEMAFEVDVTHTGPGALWNAEGGTGSKASAGGKEGLGGQERVVVHVDMDCFFVAVSLLSHPHLRGKPVAVCYGGRGSRSGRTPPAASHSMTGDAGTGGAGVGVGAGGGGGNTAVAAAAAAAPGGTAEVSSASYEARAFGVRAGMFLREARRRCPQLQLLPYDFEAYERVADEVYAILHRYAPVVQCLSCDEALLELTPISNTSSSSSTAAGAVVAAAEPEAVVARMRAEIEARTGCTASAGIAHNIMLARVATRKAKPNGQFRITKDKALDFLQELPVSDLHGVGWVLSSKLHAASIRTCGDLRALSCASLQAEHGVKTGDMLWRYARGMDDRAVVPAGGKNNQQGPVAAARKSIGADVNWGVRFRGQEDAEKFLRDLVGEVCARLHAAGVAGRSVCVKVMVRAKGEPVEPLKFMGHGRCDTCSRSRSLGPAATADPNALFRAARALFLAVGANVVDVRGVGLQVSRLEPVGGKGLGCGVFGSIERVCKKSRVSVLQRREVEEEREEEDGAEVKGEAEVAGERGGLVGVEGNEGKGSGHGVWEQTEGALKEEEGMERGRKGVDLRDGVGMDNRMVKEERLEEVESELEEQEERRNQEEQGKQEEHDEKRKHEEKEVKMKQEGQEEEAEEKGKVTEAVVARADVGRRGGMIGNRLVGGDEVMQSQLREDAVMRMGRKMVAEKQVQGSVIEDEVVCGARGVGAVIEPHESTHGNGGASSRGEWDERIDWRGVVGGEEAAAAAVGQNGSARRVDDAADVLPPMSQAAMPCLHHLFASCFSFPPAHFLCLLFVHLACFALFPLGEFATLATCQWDVSFLDALPLPLKRELESSYKQQQQQHERQQLQHAQQHHTQNPQQRQQHVLVPCHSESAATADASQHSSSQHSSQSASTPKLQQRQWQRQRQGRQRSRSGSQMEGSRRSRQQEEEQVGSRQKQTNLLSMFPRATSEPTTLLQGQQQQQQLPSVPHHHPPVSAARPCSSAACPASPACSVPLSHTNSHTCIHSEGEVRGVQDSGAQRRGGGGRSVEERWDSGGGRGRSRGRGRGRGRGRERGRGRGRGGRSELRVSPGPLQGRVAGGSSVVGAASVVARQSSSTTGVPSEQHAGDASPRADPVDPAEAAGEAAAPGAGVQHMGLSLSQIDPSVLAELSPSLQREILASLGAPRVRGRDHSSTRRAQGASAGACEDTEPGRLNECSAACADACCAAHGTYCGVVCCTARGISPMGEARGGGASEGNTLVQVRRRGREREVHGGMVSGTCEDDGMPVEGAEQEDGKGVVAAMEGRVAVDNGAKEAASAEAASAEAASAATAAAAAFAAGTEASGRYPHPIWYNFLLQALQRPLVPLPSTSTSHTTTLVQTYEPSPHEASAVACCLTAMQPSSSTSLRFLFLSRPRQLSTYLFRLNRLLSKGMQPAVQKEQQFEAPARGDNGARLEGGGEVEAWEETRQCVGLLLEYLSRITQRDLEEAHAVIRAINSHAQPAAASSPQLVQSVAARSLRPRALPVATRSLQPRAASRHTQPSGRSCLLPAAPACCLLPAALPAACRSCLPPAYCLLPAAACLQPACSLPAACLLPACCLLPIACLPACLPPACRLSAACLLPACCRLPACCLLPLACSLPACCSLPAYSLQPTCLPTCCLLPPACSLPPACLLLAAPASCLCLLPPTWCLLLAAPASCLCLLPPTCCVLPLPPASASCLQLAACCPCLLPLPPASYLVPAASACCLLPLPPASASCLLLGACCLCLLPAVCYLLP